MINEVNWVIILSALLTPTIALCAVALGLLQYRLAIKNREDKLFDQRYQFYKEAQLAWRNSGGRGGEGHDIANQYGCIELLSYQADFLFDSNISQHLRSLNCSTEDSEFSEPFLKYFNR
jgi:phosphomevalonate kinase